MTSSVDKLEPRWADDIKVARMDGGMAEPSFPAGMSEVLRYVRMNGHLPLVFRDEDAAPYITGQSRAISLHRFRCTADDTAVSAISFLAVKYLNLDKLNSLGSGECIESEPIPLYHSHVLWCYVIRLTRGDKYTLSIVSVGSCLSEREKPDEQLLPRDDAISQAGSKNDLPGLAAPFVYDGSFQITDEADKSRAMLEFERSSDGSFSVGRQFSKQELLDYAVALPYSTAKKNLSMILILRVAPSYFSLPSIIDLEAKPTVSTATRDIVEAILRGEKPAGCDWEITGGYSCSDRPSPVYHVNKASFARVSPAIQEALDSVKLGKFELIELVDGGKRGILCSFNDAAVRMAIHIVYGLPIPLPEPHERAKPLIEQMSCLFSTEHFNEVVIQQWEREICRKALALDVRDPSTSSMTALLHLLDVIWDAPYGSFPVAKRIAIGVLADMMHLSCWASVDQFIRESVLPCQSDSGCPFEHLFSILESMTKLLAALSYSYKNGIGPTSPVMEKPNSDSSDFSSGEEEESEEEDDSHRLSCTIL